MITAAQCPREGGFVGRSGLLKDVKAFKKRRLFAHPNTTFRLDASPGNWG